jgi:dihydrodipicolinate synthase/N-acetylneuraminate lyase
LNPLEYRERWRGVVAPLVTPFKDDHAVDYDALQSNVEWLLGRGARQGNTIFLVAGSGGDWPMMDLDERKRVIRTVVDTTSGKVPVIAGAQSLDLRVSIALCQFCEDLAVDAVQISAPAYWAGRRDDVLAWMTEASRNTSIPFALYNNWYTGYNMSFELVEELLELPNAVGIKWTSPDIDAQVAGFVRWRDRVAVIDNSWQTISGHLHGIRAWVSHLPNFYPEWCWQVWELMESGDYQAAQREFDRVFVPYSALVEPIAKSTAGEGVFVRPAMEARGLVGGRSRLPSRDDAVTPAIRAGFRELLAGLQAEPV